MFVFISVSKPFALIFFSGFYADPQNAFNQTYSLMITDIGEILRGLHFYYLVKRKKVLSMNWSILGHIARK